MKSKVLKRVFAALAAALVLCVFPLASGCLGGSGRDGVNGKDLNIYDIWEETKEQTGNSDLTFDEFLHEYLSYDGGELSEAVTLKAAINRSLMSAVSLITTFTEGYRDQSYYGSGVIIDVDKQAGDMTIVTNCHVVYSAAAKSASGDGISPANGFAKSVLVWLYGSDYHNSGYDEAEIIAASKSYDIAVLRVTGSDIVKNSMAEAAHWYAGEEQNVGETVYAVGNANGDDIAVSVGYISKDSEDITVNMGTDRITEYFNYRVLRTDTAINGGNSGGGLFDRSGELVGIVNAKTISDEIDNMGYALCASTVRRVVDKLIAEADGDWGIDIVTPGFSYEVNDKYSTGLDENGVARIREVVEITAAATNFGFTSGDVLTNVKIERGGKVVEDINIERLHNLEDALIAVRAGDTVTYTVKRGSDEESSSKTYSYGNFERAK